MNTISVTIFLCSLALIQRVHAQAGPGQQQEQDEDVSPGLGHSRLDRPTEQQTNRKDKRGLFGSVFGYDLFGGQTHSPYATGYAAAPYATGYAAAPYGTGYAAAPYATGYSAAPYATGYAAAPYATGYSAAPYATGYAAAPYATGYAAAPYATGYAAAPYATGYAAAPVVKVASYNPGAGPHHGPYGGYGYAAEAYGGVATPFGAPLAAGYNAYGY